ncbi:Cytochrome bo(3) ubiquinol oxidase subunit 1 [Rhodobacteraceae bacterium THAF1]|uniref:cbb3-type cytochrome c oxidase subunit I n=1 Tax=Palleronia sp. THAF1 TaxID=2587842 RepID=UPI000F3B87B9|nr:cbb3-type cytochrome c oxidase subunit I [Palleronia sp. THAF1]QFU08516.1 Cytochrome bo(3) ubiquinol oxidase subunit 1 [Palleronia sp. THAF1]VDC28608.1 Cytochrome bo(3) ubiquinol oxidase subunit 1 [Rhodobacteraceae bacterium THAF1]
MNIFGRLHWDDLKLWEVFHDFSIDSLVASGAAWGAVFAFVALIGWITYLGRWGWLYREWLTTVDHKKIGIMYMIMGFVMFARGIAEGVAMRSHQATALDGGVLSAYHYAELFSTHGTIMIFFVAMPFINGFINYLVPLQIGSRDMAFPMLNQISLALTATGAALCMISLVVGAFETGGWTAYPPFTSAAFDPGPGPDYWVWAIAISGFGSTFSGINYSVTIYKMRAPGMKFMFMPVFTWTALCTGILMTFALPPLTVAAIMQALDRYLDFHFFTNDLGGNMMNYANLFWMFGHPEVYILILPAYGIFSELVSTFGAKRIYGYTSLVIATMSIAVLSFMVWLHHFFTMGNSATVNVAFGIATGLIAIPTGVKVYVWMTTLWRGRIRFTVPIVYMAGFLILFTIGGFSGIILANPSINWQVHNTQFVVAHFHNVLLPGLLFGTLAGVHIWFPKAFGFRLDERAGKITAMLWIVGFCLTFLPLYVVGLMGYPRRSAAFDDPAFVPYMIVCVIGAFILLTAFAGLFATLYISIRNRDRLAVPLGDPWDGRTLEWATPSPPPPWNFPVIPEVVSRDAFAKEKSEGRPYVLPPEYRDIHLPPPTAAGLVIFLATTAFGFAMTWYMWWLAILSVVVVIGWLVMRSFREHEEVVIPAVEVRRVNNAWIEAIQLGKGVNRDHETSSANRGYAASDYLKEGA